MLLQFRRIQKIQEKQKDLHCGDVVLGMYTFHYHDRTTQHNDNWTIIREGGQGPILGQSFLTHTRTNHPTFSYNLISNNPIKHPESVLQYIYTNKRSVSILGPYLVHTFVSVKISALSTYIFYLTTFLFELLLKLMNLIENVTRPNNIIYWHRKNSVKV